MLVSWRWASLHAPGTQLQCYEHFLVKPQKWRYLCSDIVLFSCQADLLIASCDLVSAGHLRDPANMLPCIGNSPYKQGCAECSTEMQLYSAPNAEMMILQQRAPPMLGRCCPPPVLQHCNRGSGWRRYAEQHLPGCAHSGMPSFEYDQSASLPMCRQEQAAEALAALLYAQGTEKVTYRSPSLH